MRKRKPPTAAQRAARSARERARRAAEIAVWNRFVEADNARTDRIHKKFRALTRTQLAAALPRLDADGADRVRRLLAGERLHLEPCDAEAIIAAATGDAART